MKFTDFREIEGRSLGYWGLLGFLGILIVAGLAAAYYMESNGHHVTGMNNQIVWGIPHVFAVFMIVSASGVLNVASIASVFGRAMYKPLARLSGLLAITLLIGGLTVLVLDLGKPDRLIVAMTTYNFKSIFAWNIFLYTGFMVIVAVYLWMMMERRMNAYAKHLGAAAFIWRLVLTTGTGSIFGFLVARQAYQSAVLAPTFIAFSLSYGTAIYLLVLAGACAIDDRPLGDAIVRRLKNLLATFVAASLYLVAVLHLTNLYFTRNHGIENFILMDGGIFTGLFWIGQVAIGSALPLVLLLAPAKAEQLRSRVLTASAAVVIGGFCQMYVTIIGGQAWPLNLFPGYKVSSSFFDGEVHNYAPSIWEIMLGLGGVALAIAIVFLALRLLRFLPERLDDATLDPSHAHAD